MRISTEVHIRLEDSERFRAEGLTRAGLNPVTLLVAQIDTFLGDDATVYARGQYMTAKGWSLGWVNARIDDLSTFPTDVLRAIGRTPEEH